MQVLLCPAFGGMMISKRGFLMSELKKILTAWILDIIGTETSKPDEEADTELVEGALSFWKN